MHLPSRFGSVKGLSARESVLSSYHIFVSFTTVQSNTLQCLWVSFCVLKFKMMRSIFLRKQNPLLSSLFTNEIAGSINFILRSCENSHLSFASFGAEAAYYLTRDCILSHTLLATLFVYLMSSHYISEAHLASQLYDFKLKTVSYTTHDCLEAILVC